jgi:hypothetical protein
MSADLIHGIIPDQDRNEVALQRGKHAPSRQLLSAKANIAKTGNDRRRFQRVNISLLGRFMRQNKQEYPCQIINVSAGGISIIAPVSGELGERIVIYLDTLGRIEGEIVRINPDGFALQLRASGHKREKIVNQLTWLVNKDRLSNIEDRRHDRIIPRKTKVKLTMVNGESYDCQILDISLGGAAVLVEPKPEVGQLVTLGLTPGRVIAQREQDISIEFLENLDPCSLERQFG